MERTLILVKPDIICRGLVGEIISKFEKIGLKIVGMKMLQATRETLEKHYLKDENWLREKGESYKKNKNYPEDYDDIKAGKEIVEGLIQDMMLTPIIAIIFEGHNAVQVVKKITGPTNIEQALPGTIRGDYSHDTFALANISNRPIITIIHATDNPNDAEKEIALWFNKKEIHKYKKPEEDIHYRKLDLN